MHKQQGNKVGIDAIKRISPRRACSLFLFMPSFPTFDLETRRATYRSNTE